MTMRPLIAASRAALLLTASVLAVVPVPARAQLTAPDSLDAYYVDFSVPDLPAFTLLGVNGDRVSRPGNVRELATALTNSIGEGGGLEQGVGLELAPLRLAANPRTLNDYRPLRDRLSLSGGAVRGGDTTRFGLGFRWVLIDRSDPYERRNGLRDSVMAALDSALSRGLTAEQRQDFQQRAGRFLIGLLPDPTDTDKLGRLRATIDLNDPPDPLGVNLVSERLEEQLDTEAVPLTQEQGAELRRFAAEYVRLVRTARGADPDTELEAALTGVARRFRERTWNALAFQIAAGTTARAAGSADAFDFEELQAFTSLSFPLIPRYGQLVVHGQLRVPLQDGDSLRATVGGQLLLGSSTKRLSLQGLYGANDSRLAEGSSARLTVGGEFRVSDGVYLELATGLNIPDEGATEFLTLGSIKYALRKDRRFTIP